MRVICTTDVAQSLPEKYRSVFVPTASPNLAFPVVVGKEYVVCGIVLFMGCAEYLVRTERNGEPDFLPAPLFQALDGRISRLWRFWATSHYDEHRVECVLGYPELVDDCNHLDDLVDNRPEAAQVFCRRLQEIEDELGMGGETGT